MGKKRQEPSIRGSMVRSMIEFVLLPLFVMLAVLLFFLHRTMYRGVSEAFQMMFDQNVRSIDSMILQSNYASSTMITYTDYNRFLRDYYEADNDYKRNIAIRNIGEMLANINVTMLGSFQGEMLLLMNDGRVIDSSRTYRSIDETGDLPWLSGVAKGGIYPYWDNDMLRLFSYDPMRNYVSFGRSLVRYQEDSLACALVRIPREAFFRFGSDPRFAAGTVVMTAEDGRVLMTEPETLPEDTVREICGKWEQDGKNQTIYGDYYVMGSRLTASRNTLFYIGNVHTMFSRSEKLQYGCMAFMACSAAMLIFVVISISGYITKPILFLAGHVMQIGENRPELLTLKENHFLETRMLEQGLLEAQQKIRILLEEVRSETEMKEKARFDALKAQINPHFLFNTLNAIRWKASMNQDHEVADILSELGFLLGETYKGDEELELIDTAIQTLDAYVKIMQVRFGNRVQFFFVIPDPIREYLIPRFCLQPLVENSFIHGMAHGKSGVIALRGELNGTDIILTLIDNGSGLQGKTLDLEKEEKQNRKGVTGIGLSNVHQRIRALFGSEYGLTVDEEVASGFKVSLRIPAKRREGKEEADESSDC